MATQTPYDVVTKVQSVGESLPTDVSATLNFESAASAAPADSASLNNTPTNIKPDTVLGPVEDGLFSEDGVVNLKSSQVSRHRNSKPNLTDSADPCER